MSAAACARLLTSFVCILAVATSASAQTTLDARAHTVRPLGSVAAACRTIGLENSGRAEGLFGANSAVELGSGTIYVANLGTGEILQFDQRGRYVGSPMLRGAGPGELSTPRSAYDARSITLHRYRGESLAVHDAAYRRISVFSPSGRFARDFSLADHLPLGSGAFVAGTSLRDGSFVLVESSRQPAAPGRAMQSERDSIKIVTIGPTGQPTWAVSGVEDSERRLPAAAPTGGEGPRTVVSRPGSPLQRVNTVVVAGGSTVHYVERTNELVRYGPSGAPATRVLLPTMPIPAFGGGPAPASLAVRSDVSDRVWVEVPRSLRDSPRVWWLVASDGGLLGSVTTPALQEPLFIGRDFVLLRAQDSDGVQFISRCPLPVVR